MILKVVEKPQTFKAVRWDADVYGGIDEFLVELRSALNDVSVVSHRIEQYTGRCGAPFEKHIVSMTHENEVGLNILRLEIKEETGYVIVVHPGTRNSIPRIQFYPDAEFAFHYLRYNDRDEIDTEN